MKENFRTHPREGQKILFFLTDSRQTLRPIKSPTP